MGVLKFPKLGLPQLWRIITCFVGLLLRWSMKQSYSPHQELSNNMWHATYTRGNWDDSWHLVVRSQIANLTSDPSFGHNLCFKCQNGSCKPILDIYVPRAFQWYKKFLNRMGFGPCNHSLKIRESKWESWNCQSGSPEIPKMGVHLGMWRFIPSHSLTLLGAWDVTPGLPS